MGIFDKAKEFAQGNQDKVNGALDKAGDAINSKTDGKYADKIDSAKGKVGDALGNEGGEQPQGEQPPAQGGDQPQGGQPGQ